jgi:hypothetical protein
VHSAPFMEPTRLFIYELHLDKDIPYATVKALKERIELSDIVIGDLIECEGTREVVMSATEGPPYMLRTIRRAADGTGIELISRTQKNNGAQPLHTSYPYDAIEMLLTEGKGYFVMDRRLKKYGL